MSIDGPQHVAIQAGQPTGQRRTFMDVLSLEIRQTFGFGAGVVMREGFLVLYVTNGEHSTAISCDLTSDGWRFVWADDGLTIAPVADCAGTVRLVAQILRTTQADLS